VPALRYELYMRDTPRAHCKSIKLRLIAPMHGNFSGLFGLLPPATATAMMVLANLRRTLSAPITAGRLRRVYHESMTNTLGAVLGASACPEGLKYAHVRNMLTSALA
jgi:hypothetical protein